MSAYILRPSRGLVDPHLGYGVWRNPSLVWLGVGGRPRWRCGAAPAARFRRDERCCAPRHARSRPLALGGVALAVVCLDAVAWNLPARAPIRPLSPSADDAGEAWTPGHRGRSTPHDPTLAAAAPPAQRAPQSCGRRTQSRLRPCAHPQPSPRTTVNIVYHLRRTGAQSTRKRSSSDASTGREGAVEPTKHLAPDEEVSEARDTANTADHCQPTGPHVHHLARPALPGRRGAPAEGRHRYYHRPRHDAALRLPAEADCAADIAFARRSRRAPPSSSPRPAWPRWP